MIMCTSRCLLLDHGHIGDQHIPSFIDSIHLVLRDDEHVTWHTNRSWPHWRSTHPFLHRFDSPSTTWSWARHIGYSLIMPTLEINTSLPSSIRSPSTTWWWACHVAFYSIMSTLEINTTLLSLIRLPCTTWSWAHYVAYSSIMPTLEINKFT
jgi:hypothetical protein